MSEIVEDEQEVELEAPQDEPVAEEGEQPEAVAEESADGEQASNEAIVVTIGDEPPAPEEETRAPEWVRRVRKENREQARRIRELQAQLEAAKPAAAPVRLTPKPTLEGHDYDPEKYETALAQWLESKQRFDLEEQAIKRAQEEQARAWESKLETYNKARADFPARDYDDAEALAQEMFSTTQQGIILQGAKNPALLVYALGKNPTKAKELADITDPVAFAIAVGELGATLKVQNKSKPPAPERVISSAGTGARAGNSSATLERLREEAARTGDMTKVVAYKRQLANKKG
jgi:hypothetical protein